MQKEQLTILKTRIPKTMIAVGFSCLLLGACLEPDDSECPVGVALNGSDFPCSCADVTWDAIPPTEEGVVCSCDPDVGFSCDPVDSGL